MKRDRGSRGGRSPEAGQAGSVLTLAALALVELEGEDDVFVVAAELAHEALRLAQLWAGVEEEGEGGQSWQKRDTKSSQISQLKSRDKIKNIILVFSKIMNYVSGIISIFVCISQTDHVLSSKDFYKKQRRLFNCCITTMWL